MILDGRPVFPKPKNAPMPGFAQGTAERKLLQEAIAELRARAEISNLPLIIGGEKVVTDMLDDCQVPHNHRRLLAKYSKASKEDVIDAINSVLNAQKKWQKLPWYMRLQIFRKAAYLLETKYFYKVTAAVMEDYSKSPYEAMIDVCELIDFWSFNAYFAYEIYGEQPDTLDHNLNMIDWRPLEGFVAAIPPNNFISIAGNLPTAPLIMGNVVVCKPARDTVFSFHAILEVLYDAGLPPEVLAVVQGDSGKIGDALLNHRCLAGVHFTGSTATFDKIVGRIGRNTEAGWYVSYPHRATVGETGGKDFMVVYDDEDPSTVAASIVVGGFGAQGRKCSAASRVFISESMWQKVEPELIRMIGQIKVGDVADFTNYMGAIISQTEYDKIRQIIRTVRQESVNVNTVIGGETDDSKGWFINPTVIVTQNPNHPMMFREIFGPVVTVCTFKDWEPSQIFDACDRGSEYALTGAVNTKNVFTLCESLDALRFAAGNIYDWKTTGAVVGQQPFGGARKSGTNNKAGSKLNLYPWTSPRGISLTHNKPSHFAPAYLELKATN